MNKRKRMHSARLPAWTVALIMAGLVTPAAFGQIQVAGELFVDMDATKLASGPVTSIVNNGTLKGFLVASGPEADRPVAGMTGGTQTLIFDGTDFLQLADAASGGNLILPPAGLVGESPTRSIEVWTLNPQVAGEETLVSWGKRGGPEGSNVSFGYGSDFRWGAVGHWGGDGPDLGWNNDGGNPTANKWHHLVYTFDGTTSRVYSDGKLANAELVREGIIATHPDTSINIAAQLEADGIAVTGALRFTGSIARVRIHDGVLTDAQIASNYALEKSAFVDPQPPPPIEPARLTKGPVSRYSFSEPASANATGLAFKDSVGTAHGTVLGEGASFTGTRLKLDGGPSATAAYADLPNGMVSKNGKANGGTGEFSFETWLKVTGSRTWSRVFDFGSSGTDNSGEVTGPGGGGTGLDYLEFSAQIGDDTGNRRLELRNEDPAGGGIVTADSGTRSFNRDVHVLVTWHELSGRINLYEDGRQIAAMTTDDLMSDLNDVNVWLGRSNWNGDQNTQGEYDEARFYDYVLTPGQALGNALAGPELINNQDVAVTISTQPLAQTIPETLPAVFSVASKGSSPISFQWFRNGQVIPGANAPAYSINAVSATDDGATFTVEVSNLVNGQPVKVVSSPAKLSVVIDPVTLRHRYSFDGAATSRTATDSVGNAHGTLEGAEGSAKLGNGILTLDGAEGYVNLPNGIISALGDNGTIELWYTYDGGPNWSRVFDFGTKDDGEDGSGNGLDYLFFTPKTAQGFGRFFANFPGGGDTTVLSTPGSTPVGQEMHLAITYSFTGNTTRVYTNGTLVATGPASRPLSALTGDVNNWLGRSQFAADAMFAGKYNEVRIYKGALTPSSVAASFASGPTKLPENVPVPVIGVRREGGNIVVTWPSASTGFTLEGASSVTSASWTGLGDGSPAVGGNFQVTVPVTGDARFLRLRR